jgi:hypothetical protein
MFADGFLLRKPKEDEIWQTESTKVMCTVYNINLGNNEDLKKRSQTLREYMIFVGYVNENLAKAKRARRIMRLQSEMRWTAVLQKNKTLEQIADELEESVKDIRPIYDIVKKHAPEYDVDVITTEVLETRENKKE